MEQKEIIQNLKNVAIQIRRDALISIHHGGSGHPGGALSVSDIITALFFKEMNIDPENPRWDDRDRFILSKGHACPAYYAALAHRGFFDKAHLKTLRKIDSILQGHPVLGKAPGVDMSSGSLGQGLSVAGGMALYGKINNKSYKVYCVIGDGESQEGQVWEAAMSASHYKLNNLICIMDNNKLQIDGPNEKVMNIQPVMDKFKAFGWNTIEIDGHDFEQLISALQIAKASIDKPTFIMCKTTKGKGVSFMENKVEWHGGSISKECLENCLNELPLNVCGV